MKQSNRKLFLVNNRYFWLGIWVLILTDARVYGQQGEITRQLKIANEMERIGNYREAQHLYRNLYKQYPKNSLVFENLRMFYFRSGEYDSLIVLLKEQLEGEPENPVFGVEMARLYYRLGSEEKALALWYSVLETHKRENRIYQMVANSMIEERLYEKAIKVFQLGREHIGNENLFCLQLADLYKRIEDYEKSGRELLSYLIIHPNQRTFVESRFLQYPKTERIAQTVIRTLQNSIKRFPGNIDLLIILKTIYTHRGQYKEGLEVTIRLEKFMKNENQGETLFNFAKEVFQAGEPLIAEKAYIEILNRYPTFIRQDRVIFGLAKTQEAQNRIHEAVKHYQRVYEINPSSLVAREALLRKGSLEKKNLLNLEGAKETFQSLITQYPSSKEAEQARCELGDCYLIQGDLKNAKNIFKSLQKKNMNNHSERWVFAVNRLAEIAFYQIDFESALAWLDKLTQVSKNLDVLRSPYFNDALRMKLLISEHVKKSGKLLRLLARAQFWRKQKQYQKALITLDSLCHKDEKSRLIEEAIFQKGQIYIHLGEYQAGLKEMNSLANRFPDGLLTDRALERRGWIFEKLGNRKEALKMYDKILIDYPHSLLIEEVRYRIRKMEGMN